MRIIIAFVWLLGVTVPSRSQTVTIDWQQTIGGSDFELPQSVNKTSDGGSIIAGTTYSSDGDMLNNHGVCDMYVVKLKADGSLDWKRNYGGSNEDGAYAIEQTKDGGYILAGYTKSNDGDVTGYHGISDCWLLKLDPQGNIQWQKALGGTEYDVALNIRQTADNGFIMAGYTISKNGDVTNKVGGDANQDVWIVKLDANGQVKWQKTYGGSNHEIPYKIIDAGNGYVVCAMSQSMDGDVTMNKGQRDIWVFKIDVNGVMQWQKSYGGTGNDFPYDIKPTVDNGYILTGSTTSNNDDMVGNHGSMDAFVMKLNGMGMLEWSRCYGGSSLESAKFVHQQVDGSYLVAGSVESADGNATAPYGKSDYWLFCIAATGNILWQKNLGGTNIDDAHAAYATNHSVVLAGTSFSSDHDVKSSKGAGDFWVLNVKFNAPVITKQPINAAICSGGNAVFAIEAINVTGYQWQVLENNAWTNLQDNAVFTGTLTDQLSVNGSASLHQTRFRCKLSNQHSHVFSDEAVLVVNQVPVVTVQPKDAKTCSGTEVAVIAQFDQVNDLQWQQLQQNIWTDMPNATQEILKVKPVYNGTNPQYRLKANNNCGKVYSNAVTVTVANCHVPNAFSPNGDGLNDTWEIPFLQNFPNHSVQVFARSGGKVFETYNGYTKNWNGSHKGNPLPAGVYYYIVQVNETNQQLSGALMIIR